MKPKNLNVSNTSKTLNKALIAHILLKGILIKLKFLAK